ncbi:CPBP family intramembrane glutamic endopeptidase [Rhodococcus oryzae]|uniref:CPBP family intramembrane glutamic endopeptidase n=1 Tax=Rhodococcus oryzae TaxID=2571143 RepID=UPI003714B020
MTTHAAPPRRWAPTAVYVLVAFLAGGVLVALQAVTGPDPDLLELVQFAPAIAVAAVLLAWRGRWRPPLEVSLWRPDPAALAAAIGSVLIILALPAAVLVALGERPALSDVPAGAAPLGLLVLAQCVGACGEELGWRGFLQPYLRTRHSVLITGVLVGTIWGGVARAGVRGGRRACGGLPVGNDRDVRTARRAARHRTQGQPVDRHRVPRGRQSRPAGVRRRRRP